MSGITILNIILSAYISILMLAGMFLDFIKSNLSKVKYLFFYSAITLIIITGLRDRGWDYHLYKKIYSSTPDLFNINLFESKWIEPGFTLILSTFKTFGFNYQLSIFLIGLVTLLLMYKSIIKYSTYPLFSLGLFYFLYYYRGTYGQIRAALAMAIIIYSIKFISNNQILRFIFLNIIAISIHVVGVVFLPALFLLKKNFSNRTLLLFLFISLAISFNSKEIYQFLIALDFGFLYKLKFYFNNNLFIEREFITFEMVKGLILSLVFIKYRKQLKTIRESNDKLIVLYIVGSIIYNLLSFDLRFASRVSVVYKIFEIFLLPQLIKVAPSKFHKVIIFILIIIVSIYTLIVEFIMMKSGTFNYYITN